ncbi:MAG: hypothetical protein PHP01_01360 [Phycisphaerae bacterium]|nr:hypothetical protein [Phycisphaerae bacterium]
MPCFTLDMRCLMSFMRMVKPENLVFRIKKGKSFLGHGFGRQIPANPKSKIANPKWYALSGNN